MNSQSGQGRGYHSILIVEDDRAVRESLKFSLVIEGFAVRAYADAEHLLAEPRLPEFDCLIVDQNMPGMNGLDLVSQLRARRIDTPAILITSHPNQSLRDRAFESKRRGSGHASLFDARGGVSLFLAQGMAFRCRHHRHYDSTVGVAVCR